MSGAWEPMCQPRTGSIWGMTTVASCDLENLLHCRDGQTFRLPGLNKPLYVSERTIRRIITLIAVLAIIVLALSLALHFAAQYAGLQQSQRQQLLTLLRLAGHGLNDITRNGGTARMPTRADLERLLPGFALENGRMFIIADDAGTARVVLAAGKTPAAVQEGAPLPSYLRDAFELESGYLHLVQDPAGAPLLIGTMPLATGPGRLLVAQPAGRLNDLWASSANMLTSLFIGLFIIIVGLISVYNWQAAQAERARRERSRFIDRLEKALTLGRCGLWDWDVARGRIYLSSSMCGLLGLPKRDGYIDMADFIALQHPEEKPVDVLLEEGLEAGNDTFEHEIRLRKADGGWLWLKLRGALPARTEGEADTSRHLVGIAVDITAQKQAAAAMRSAEQRLLTAIESLSESFVLWNEHMRMVMCNSKFREFHGLPERACRPGAAYADIMRQARHPVRNRRLQRIYSDGPEQESIMELEMANGRWLHISERTMPDGSLVSVGTDITELKAKQLELEQSKRELQETVEALQQSRREIESQNERLKDMARRAREAQQAAEEALRIKSQFLANVSHELRTPLNHILVPAEAMRMERFGALAPKYLEYAQQIYNSGQEVLRKITDMLEFAELSAGEGKLQREETDLQHLIAKITEEFLPQAQAKGLHFGWHVQPGLRARVDGKRLQTLLRQLVSNAVRFTEKGEVFLKAETHADKTLVIEVRDTGIGIPQDKIDRIGQPFERAGDAYNSHRGGSGIGLAIAKIITELHGGRLEITSEEGKGTRVRCIIPLREDGDAGNPPAPPRAPTAPPRDDPDTEAPAPIRKVARR